jgi:hypothetical protein
MLPAPQMSVVEAAVQHWLGFSGDPNASTQP